MSNPVCSATKIELPIVQAAMGGASCPELAAAVSNAGGLGMLALSWSSADDMRSEIRKTRELTVRPFGVNLVLHWPQEHRLAVCLEEGVPIISFFWGQAGRLIEVAHRGGAKVLHTIASADAARRAVDHGTDMSPRVGGGRPRSRHGRHYGARANGRRSGSEDASDCRRRNRRRPRTRRGDGPRSLRCVDWDALSRKSRSGDSFALSRSSPGGERDRHRIRQLVRCPLARCASPSSSQQHIRGMAKGWTAANGKTTW